MRSPTPNMKSKTSMLSTTRSKWLLATGGAAGLAIVGVLSVAGDPGSAEEAEAESAAIERHVSRDAPDEAAEVATRRHAERAGVKSTGACGLSAGQQFAATYLSESTYNVAASPGAGQPGDAGKTQTVSGYLAFEVLDASQSSAVVLVRFSSDGERQSEADGQAQELSTPFLARVNEKCEVAEFARHHDTSRKMARLQQSLLHELWFSVPLKGQKTQVTFANSVGKAMGEIRADDRGDLMRTINLYRETWSPDMAGVRVGKSTMRVERGEAPWFSSIHGEQRLSVPSSLASGRSTLRVEATDHDPDALAEASRDTADYVWESMLKPFSNQVSAPEPIGHGKRVAAMKDVTFEQILERFGTLVETKALREEQHLIMAAFLDAHPEHIDEYSKALATHFPDNWKPQGYAALQVTQNPAAKTALLNLYREDRLAPMERVRSSLALAGRVDVGAPLALELSAVATSGARSQDRVSVPEHALMHLGVLAGLHSDDEEVVTITRQTLSAKLMSAQTPQELKSACLAVANTGDLSFLPALRDWSEHDDSDMREQVAIGMRRMPVEGARDFVLEWLSRERSFRVKREIFEVLQRQYHDAGAVLDDALIAQTVAHLDQRPRALTRQSIYRLLTPAVRIYPDVRRALREALVMEIKKEAGLAHYVMSILPQQDVNVALANIDTLADQFSTSPSAPSPTDPTIQVEPEDVEPPADMAAVFGDMVLGSEPEGVPSVTE